MVLKDFGGAVLSYCHYNISHTVLALQRKPPVMSLFWPAWCCISVITLSLGSVLATNISCPTWFYYDNSTQQCHCGYGLLCSSNKEVEIKDGLCATSAGEGDQYYISNCPFRHTVNNTNRIYSEMPADPDLLDNVMCGPYKRKGLLCGRCIDGYGPTAHILDLRCANCSKYYGILLYLVLELFPITLFFFCIVLFRFNITTGPLLGYVIFCQVHLAWMKENGYMYEYIQYHVSPSLAVMLKISVTLSQFWSLQYVTPVIPPFCISEKLSDIDILMLSLVPATYPIVLLTVILISAYLHAKNCNIIQAIWKLFTTVLDKMNIKPVTGEAVIHAFASFVFLSNVTVYTTMGSLLDLTHIYRQNSTSYQHSLRYDPTLEWLSYKHIEYILIALVPFTFLTLIPSVFHIIYPTRIYGYLSRCLSARKRLAITTFAEALQVCFKDGLNGTKDYRSLVGLVTIIPIIHEIFNKIMLRMVGIRSKLSNIITIVITCCIITYIQPCKSSIANISASINLLLFGGLHAIGYWWQQNQSIPTETLILALIIIPLLSHILVFMWAGYTLISYIMRRCGYHFDHPCGCIVVLVNGVKKCLHRRHSDYQELN